MGLHSASARHPRTPVPTPGGDGSGSRQALICPRCKGPSARGAPKCLNCGFSFLETRILRPARLRSHVGPHLESGEDPAELESPPFDDDPLVGSIVGGRYRVLSFLGEGGFGVVYKVEFLLFEDPTAFAMKVLHSALSRSDTFRRRFLREARLSMALVHENIVQVREFGQTEDGLLYFTMDFCEGQSLGDLLSDVGVMPVPRALEVTRQILRALTVSHSQGVVHRDLKPGNIFLDVDSKGGDFVKVGDFGLAKSIDRRNSDITHGGIVGSPRYMSPEQASGGSVDVRTDLFSLGVILYEMLYGTVPSERQLEGGPGGLLDETPHSPVQYVSRRLFSVLRRALAVDPQRRYQTAEEFIAGIDSLPEITASRRRARALTVLRGFKRVGARVLLIALVAAVFFVGSTSFFGSSPGKRFAATSAATLRQWLHDPAPVPSPRPEPPAPEPAPAQVERVAAVVPAAAQVVGPIAGEVADYFPLEEGRTYTYQVFRKGQAELETRIRFEVRAESPEGCFLVLSQPDDQYFYWVVDEVENSVKQVFRLPHPETGELDREESRILLRLPRDPTASNMAFENRVGDGKSTVTVEFDPGPVPVPVHGETLNDCMKVVEIEPDLERTTVRYYQKGIGEVVYMVRDDRRDEVVYMRTLVKEEKLAPIRAKRSTAGAQHPTSDTLTD